VERITASTTLEELAAIVSTTLDAAGITAVLSGGAVVSIYTNNEYESSDLDFISARSKPCQPRGLGEAGRSEREATEVQASAGEAQGRESLTRQPRMPHVLEPASSGRSKCRGCRLAIAKGELRFGEALPNPFGEGEVTHWFHPRCAAYKRPEPLLATLESAPEAQSEALRLAAEESLAHPRLQRIDGAERAPSGQARCRHCKAPIERGAWRIRLVFHEEGTFSPGGYIHAGCRQDYFEYGDILERVLDFSPALDAAERDSLRAELGR
jgi:hypothetical protein